MKAVVLTGHGGLDKLEYREDVVKPQPGAGEVLIRVGACGLNQTDVNTRIAWYAHGVEQGVTADAALHGYVEGALHDDSADGADGGWGGALSFPRIQGADVCGVVEGVGAGVAATLVQARVMVDPWLLDSAAPMNLAGARYFGSEVDGGFAEYAVAPAQNVYAVQSDYTDAELATFGCAYTTAENLLTKTAVGGNAGVDPSDECVVVSGASGGVGSAVIQLAKLRGARVIALSSAEKISTGKAGALRQLGADHVVDRQSPQLVNSILDAAGGEVDVAIDPVGGAVFGTLLQCLKRGGRYASCGTFAGSVVPFDLRKLVYRDLQLSGATVVPPGVFARLLGYIETKKLRPVLACAFPLGELAEAQRAFIAKKHVGNIVVTMA